MSENKRQYAHDIRTAIQLAVRQVEENPANIHIPSTGQRGAVIGIINHIAGGDDNRKLLLGWLFAKEGEAFDRLSTKLLNDAQWASLYAWCDFNKDEERIIWLPKPSFPQECLAVLSAAMDDYLDMNYVDRGELPVPPDLVANALNYGGGEITYTGIKTSGVKGVPEDTFDHDKELPDTKTPSLPYRKASPIGREDVQEKIDDYELEQEERRVHKPAVRPAVSDEKPPKLINPF